MKQSNIDYLESNMQHLINARADFFKNLGGETRSNFERIMSEEFRPGYRADISCDKCALEMMKILDIYYRQWKDAQPVIQLAELSINPGQVTRAANFPKHEQRTK